MRPEWTASGSKSAAFAFDSAKKAAETSGRQSKQPLAMLQVAQLGWPAFSVQHGSLLASWLTDAISCEDDDAAEGA